MSELCPCRKIRDHGLFEGCHFGLADLVRSEIYIVIEAVVDSWAQGELGVRIGLFYCLRQEMGEGMAAMGDLFVGHMFILAQSRFQAIFAGY